MRESFKERKWWILLIGREGEGGGGVVEEVDDIEKKIK